MLVVPFLSALPKRSIEVKNETIEDDFEKYYTKIQDEKIIMPNVIGMPAMDAVSLLENLGLEVKFRGKGKVKAQSVSAGQKIKNNQQVNLHLS